MSSVLYGMIHNKASVSYKGPEIKAKNYQLWIDHWFKTAYEIADDFDNEGLTATADAVRKIIIDNARLIK